MTFLPQFFDNAPLASQGGPWTYLSGAIAASGVTTITPLSTANFHTSTAGQFEVVIEEERIIVCSNGLGAWTVIQRGANNSTAAAHADGSAIYGGVLSAQALLRSPGPMTAAYDMYYLGADGAPTRFGVGSEGQSLQVVGGVPAWHDASAGGLTSVGLALPNIFSVSGTPLTSNGTITASLATQAANVVFAGPTTGSAASPTFRALVAADIPSLTASKISDLASATVSFTNKSGNVSQWTNDASYTTLAAVAGVGYLTSVTAHNLLSATHGDTTAASVSRGDLITGQGASPTWKRLGKGSNLAYLTGDGTDVAWSAGLLSIASAKTLTVSNTVTLTATDGSTLAIGGGGTLGTAAYTAASAYEVPLTFSTGLTRTTNTITVNTSQNISTLSNLTSNGVVTTSGGTGALAVTGTTGTGNVVLASSPTLVTPTLGAASATSLNVTAGIIKGNNGFSDLVMQDGAGNVAFRSVSSSGWADSVTAQFFQVGPSLGDVVFSAAGGTAFARLLFSGTATQITAGSYNTTPVPGGVFEILDSSNSLLFRFSSAVLQLGADINGSAIAQTLQSGKGITGTDKTGANLTLRPGAGTGAGAVPSLIIQTPTATTTGTTAQTQATRLTITQGSLTLADATDLVFGTTTGTKHGTSASQKQSFWGATPVVQQVLATGASHTVDDVITFLQTVGLCKQS